MRMVDVLRSPFTEIVEVEHWIDAERARTRLLETLTLPTIFVEAEAIRTGHATSRDETLGATHNIEEQ